MDRRASLAGLVIVALCALAPTRALAQCDPDAVRVAIDAARAPIARMLRAHDEPEHPERWRRAGPVTIGEPTIAPVLPDGCSGAIVEYAWTITDRRAPAQHRWRHGIALFAVQSGRARLVTRRALHGWDDEPPHHGVSFEPGGVIVARIGGGGDGGGWGSEERFRLQGRRLVPIDTLHVGPML